MKLLRRTCLVIAALWSGVAVAAPDAASPAAGCPPAPPDARAVAAAVNAPAQDRGLLWRIRRDGRTSWLFGTIHMGKPQWRRFGPRIDAALRASDELALEIDPADPALADALSDTAPGGFAITPEAQARLQRAYARACINSAALATLHPLLQAMTLSLLDARWLGLDSSQALELLLAERARQAGLPVVALETVAQQKAALIPADEARTQAALAQALAELEDPNARVALARLVAAWEQGDLSTLSSYAQWCGCAETEEDRAALRELNDVRNPGLADGITARHAAGRRVFAAVGALHMTGPQGLPLLLAQRGFVVERVAFSR